MEYFPSKHPNSCIKCPLGAQAGIRVVHPVLPKHAKVLFVGESPGSAEQNTGIPFVGSAGELLNQIFQEVGINRNDVSIANVVCCRPPDNRMPAPKEVKACMTFLDEEIRDIKPELIVPLGSTALKAILPGMGGITIVRGQVFDHPDYLCKVIPTLHPAFVLRSPMERSKLVSDLNTVSLFIQGKHITKEKKPVNYYVVRTIEQFDWVISQLHEKKRWSCDTETTALDFLTAEIFILTFSWQEYTSVLIDLRLLPEHKEYVWVQLKGALENDSEKIFQNGPFDIKLFMRKDIYVNNYFADTMLQSYLLDENSANDLGALAYSYTDCGGYDAPLEQYKIQNRIESYDQIPMDIIHPYANTDADVTFRSYNAMVPLLTNLGLDFVFRAIMIPTQTILLFTEYHGISVDMAYLKATDLVYEGKMQRHLQVLATVPQVKQYEADKKQLLTAELYKHWEESRSLTKKYPEFSSYVKARQEKKPDIIDFSFNINSYDQLVELLIDRMKLPVIVRTKKQAPSVNDDALQEYAKTNAFCKSFAEYRTLGHLKSTFLTGMLSKTDGNKIHTHYLLHSTTTGRLSSRSPNLNNIPRTGTANDIKDIFCCDNPGPLEEGGDWLAEADLGQAEFRCIEGSQRVLMANFTYKCIKEISVGDKILALDENSSTSGRRKLRVAEVLGVYNQGFKECVRVSSGKNKIINTFDHRFLRTTQKSSSYKWKMLQDGDFCAGFPIEGIIDQDEYLKGMIFGLYLTDGHMEKCFENTLTINICQIDKEVLLWCCVFLRKLGIECIERFGRNDKYIYLYGINVEKFLEIIGKGNSFDYRRGLIAGCILGDGWFCTTSKIQPQQTIGLGLSISHPEVLQIVYTSLEAIKETYPDFNYRVYNFPIRDDFENKPFYHFYLTSNAMLLFPQLIPGKKQKKYYEHLSRFTTLQNMNIFNVSIESMEGKYETWDLATTTGTFICENFFVHNCWINYSQDPQALRDLGEGIDIHRLMGAAAYHGIKLPKGDISYALFKELTKDVTKDERQNTKLVIFGIMYGRGAASVAEQLGISIRKAQEIIDQFFQRYPLADRWLKITVAKVQRDGYITNLFGRRRRIPEIRSTNDGKRAEARRQSINSPVQSAASDYLFLSMIRIHRKLWAEQMKSRLVLTVYDSQAYNIPDNELKTTLRLLYDEMTNHPYPNLINVPMTADIKVGTHWGSLMEIDMSKPWDDVYDELKKHRLKEIEKFSKYSKTV